MIIEEFFEINGTSHVRHYSDAGVKVASADGVEYDVAEDYTSLGKVYHETETPIDDAESADELLTMLEDIL